MRHTEDAVQRRAKLVAHHRQKVGLGLVGRFRRPLGLAQGPGVGQHRLLGLHLGRNVQQGPGQHRRPVSVCEDTAIGADEQVRTGPGPEAPGAVGRMGRIDDLLAMFGGEPFTVAISDEIVEGHRLEFDAAPARQGNQRVVRLEKPQGPGIGDTHRYGIVVEDRLDEGLALLDLGDVGDGRRCAAVGQPAIFIAKPASVEARQLDLSGRGPGRQPKIHPLGSDPVTLPGG